MISKKRIQKPNFFFITTGKKWPTPDTDYRVFQTRNLASTAKVGADSHRRNPWCPELIRNWTQPQDEPDPGGNGTRAIFKSWFMISDPVRYKATGQEPPGLAPHIADLFPPIN